jgi:hypothetical protein
MAMTYRDLHGKLYENPFKPFRIRMVNNTVYDIREPWMVMVGRTSAVVATRIAKGDRGIEIADDWKTVSIRHMLEFSDRNVRSNGSRRRKQ